MSISRREAERGEELNADHTTGPARFHREMPGRFAGGRPALAGAGEHGSEKKGEGWYGWGD